jgi:hypothetical protein
MATRLQAKSLTDAVHGAVARRSVRKTWYDCLPDGQKRELAAVRAQYHEGQFAGTVGVVANAIIEACKERGIKTAGKQGVVHWLKQKD